MTSTRWADEETILERRARATGTRVALVWNGSADPDQPWETICVDHGGVCSHETRKLAEGWLSHPDEWCEDCMYGVGTLSGERPAPSTQDEPEAEQCDCPMPDDCRDDGLCNYCLRELPAASHPNE